MYVVVCITSHIYVCLFVLHSEITTFVSKLSLLAAGDDSNNTNNNNNNSRARRGSPTARAAGFGSTGS